MHCLRRPSYPYSTAFLAPVSSGGQMLLRSAAAAKSVLPAARLHRRVQISALKMQEDGNDSTPAPPAPAGEIDEAEMERRYRQQNSGVGYRKNNQDGALQPHDHPQSHVLSHLYLVPPWQPPQYFQRADILSSRVTSYYLMAPNPASRHPGCSKVARR